MSNFNTAGWANQNIRNRAKEKGIPMWELAASLGISESTISRRLRVELPQQEQERFMRAIDSLYERTSGAANG